MSQANTFLKIFKDSYASSINGDLERLQRMWNTIEQSDVSQDQKEEAQARFASIVAKNSISHGHASVTDWALSHSIDPYKKQKVLKNCLVTAALASQKDAIQVLVKHWVGDIPNAGAEINFLLSCACVLEPKVVAAQCLEILIPLATPLERHHALLEFSRMNNTEFMDLLIPYCNVRAVISEQLDDDDDMKKEDLYLYQRWQNQQLNAQLSEQLLPAIPSAKPSKM